MSKAPLNTVNDYHQQTKHQTHQYARAPGYMDWANQPLPYRLYQGAEKWPLVLLNQQAHHPYSALFKAVDTPAEQITLTAIASMLELSLGLSAWKEYNGSEWALRINPSSGNLHPTECYLLLPELDQQPASSVHYNPYIHSLALRAEIPSPAAQQLKQADGFALMLCSIAWREAWKYGERAYRYTQHDLGHALGALSIACNLNGWQIQLLPNISATTAESVLGLSLTNPLAAETEYVDCVCWVSRTPPDVKSIEQWFDRLPTLNYQHQANQLSKAHQPWPIIDEVFLACQQQPQPLGSPYPSVTESQLVDSIDSNKLKSAETIIRQRRSAQSFDQTASQLPLNTFLHNLDKTLPCHAIPFSVLPYDAKVHLVLFVHNVEGLASGLYLYLRNAQHLPLLKMQLDARFEWIPVMAQQPLYLLERGDFREIAKAISCNQDIAADSAYSLAMLAQFETVLSEAPNHYPTLFWETGLIGQVLYLQAEAFELRGTGIGCFFDDQMHQLLGLNGQQWQSLYHFTVGKHIDDLRLATKPAYFHLQK